MLQILQKAGRGLLSARLYRQDTQLGVPLHCSLPSQPPLFATDHVTRSAENGRRWRQGVDIQHPTHTTHTDQHSPIMSSGELADCIPGVISAS